MLLAGHHPPILVPGPPWNVSQHGSWLPSQEEKASKKAWNHRLCDHITSCYFCHILFCCCCILFIRSQLTGKTSLREKRLHKGVNTMIQDMLGATSKTVFQRKDVHCNTNTGFWVLHGKAWLFINHIIVSASVKMVAISALSTTNNCH